jgi:hypothetical protein
VAVWDRLTTLIAGGALSRSAGTALDAAFETTRQQARGARAVRVLDPGTAAELRARETTGDVDGIDLQGVDLEDDAQRGALGHNRFDLLTELARTQPGVGELFALRRRGIGTDDHLGLRTRSSASTCGGTATPPRRSRTSKACCTSGSTPRRRPPRSTVA